MESFLEKIGTLRKQHEMLLSAANVPVDVPGSLVTRYKNPVVTAAHVPLEWRYDLDPVTNPYCLERIGVNACMNAGAIKWNGKYRLMVRVEGYDRKSYFAIAESPNGVVHGVRPIK